MNEFFQELFDPELVISIKMGSEKEISSTTNNTDDFLDKKANQKKKKKSKSILNIDNQLTQYMVVTKTNKLSLSSFLFPYQESEQKKNFHENLERVKQRKSIIKWQIDF